VFQPSLRPWTLVQMLATLGTMTRDVGCFVDTAVSHTQVTMALCASSVTTPIPESVSACNRVPCPSATYSRVVSAWGSCVGASTCPGTVGFRNRTVLCVQTDSSNTTNALAMLDPSQLSSSSALTVADSFCGGSLDRVQSCVVTGGSGACTCTQDSECPNINSRCSSGVCGCKPGYIGDRCEIEVSRFASSSCAGVIDAVGTCCTGAISSTGICCGAGTVLDGKGVCCASKVDACGICGGSGVLLDVEGKCCNTLVSQSGVCCASGQLDDCGESSE
jgi:hypothetical protein